MGHCVETLVDKDWNLYTVLEFVDIWTLMNTYTVHIISWQSYLDVFDTTKDIMFCVNCSEV